MATTQKIEELLHYIGRPCSIRLFISGRSSVDEPAENRLYKIIPNPDQEARKDLDIVVPSPEAAEKLVKFIHHLRGIN